MRHITHTFSRRLGALLLCLALLAGLLPMSALAANDVKYIDADGAEKLVQAQQMLQKTVPHGTTAGTSSPARSPSPPASPSPATCT